jgi:alpha-mannosidase II
LFLSVAVAVAAFSNSWQFVDGRVEDDEGLAIMDPFELKSAAQPVRNHFRAINKTLRIHLIPHVHADTGWQITFDECFDQLLNPIISTTMAALAKSPDRRYMWSEVSFFKRWWGIQNDTTRKSVQKLVKQQQLEFVEGGWSQADEIVASLDGRLTNLVFGNAWLSKTFGIKPRIAWKIDPFGASALSPKIFESANFDAVVKVRVPWELKDRLGRTGGSEFIWEQPAEQGGAKVFCHVLRSYSGLCGQGFDFGNAPLPSCCFLSV